MRAVALFGADWTRLGVVGRADLDAHTALANSRGRLRKRYRYVDPNEDVVAAARTDVGAVLVCADGHNGEPASRLAVQAILDAAPDLDSPAALLDAFVAANEAVLDGALGPRNRTTLGVVALTADAAHWAAMGDSTLVLLREDAAPLRLGDPRMHFVGHPMTRAEVDERVPRGTVERRPGDCWALVTDGLEEFLPGPEPVVDVVAALAARTATARELADALVEAAFDGGAGDNVAAVVHRAPEAGATT